MEETWDGLPVARDHPWYVVVVVWRRSAPGREYLLLHRAHHGPDYAGDWAWTSPAGARQPGEDVVEAARRELVEETGLVLTLNAVDGPLAERALFHAEAPPGAVPRLDAEHDAFEWVAAAEAASRCLPALAGEAFGLVEAVLGPTETP